MTDAELDVLFAYHPPTEEARALHLKVNVAVKILLDGGKDLVLIEGSPDVYAAINALTKNLAVVINAVCPPSADTSAAIRCVRLARNAMTETVTRPLAAGATRRFLHSLAAGEIMKAKWQANAAIALHYSAPKAVE